MNTNFIESPKRMYYNKNEKKIITILKRERKK